MSVCPPCPTPADCACDSALQAAAPLRPEERGGTADRCLRCHHTRGVYKPHCRLESGCDCKEFV
mgnify:CR=1 FL=1